MHCPSPQLVLASLLPLTSVSGGSLHFPPGVLLTAYTIVGPTKYHTCMRACVLSAVWLFATSWSVAC